MDNNLILNAMLSLISNNTQPKEDVLSDFIGKYVLIRHHMFGVNTGYLESFDNNNIVLTQSRKFWRWAVNKGVSLEDLAKSGVNHNGDIRISAVVGKVIISRVQLLGVMAIDDGNIIENIKTAPVYKN